MVQTEVGGMTTLNKVTIGSSEYKIKRSMTLPSSYTKSNIQFGEISLLEKEILINARLPSNLQAEALLHEVLHGLFHSTGLNRSLSSFSCESEEEIVTLLSRGLCGVFKTSPKLLDYLKDAVCAKP